MAQQRRNPNEELADAIASLRLATAEREGAIPGSQEYDDALTTEELINGLVLDLVRQRNRTALDARAHPSLARAGASTRPGGSGMIPGPGLG